MSKVYEMPRMSPQIKVRGVGRVADEPRALLVLLDEIPTDDELRNLHETLRHWEPWRDHVALAEWMIARGYTTGHGDTAAELLAELERQIEEKIERICNGALASTRQP